MANLLKLKTLNDHPYLVNNALELYSSTKVDNLLYNIVLNIK